jgi:hypothetical protein
MSKNALCVLVINFIIVFENFIHLINDFKAHIWTKSKFLGLSIGVNNVGHGSIYLLDKGEEYVCTFPSAYGRSILTVPWVELGGPVSITCQQTGFSAHIDFQTKVSINLFIEFL